VFGLDREHRDCICNRSAQPFNLTAVRNLVYAEIANVLTSTYKLIIVRVKNVIKPLISALYCGLSSVIILHITMQSPRRPPFLNANFAYVICPRVSTSHSESSFNNASTFFHNTNCSYHLTFQRYLSCGPWEQKSMKSGGSQLSWHSFSSLSLNCDLCFPLYKVLTLGHLIPAYGVWGSLLGPPMTGGVNHTRYLIWRCLSLHIGHVLLIIIVINFWIFDRTDEPQCKY